MRLVAINLPQALDGFMSRPHMAQGARLRRVLLRLLAQLVYKSNVLPLSIYLEGFKIDPPYPVASGGFGEVYRGKIRDVDIAVKRLKSSHGVSQSLLWSTSPNR